MNFNNKQYQTATIPQQTNPQKRQSQINLKKIENYLYDITQLIGQGTFGKVFKGTDEKTKQNVAIKVISKQMIENDQHLCKNLNNEISIMKKLKHQNIVEFKEMLMTTNNIYIIQEFCNNGDLYGYIQKNKRLNEYEAKEILIQILQGFQQLIQYGIIHRDLKPENILKNGEYYKLADFGFSRSLKNVRREQIISRVGTPLYMCPQILDNQTYTSKSDIWSLGLIYYEMLYGSTPWEAQTIHTLIEKIKRDPLVFPDQPEVSQLSKNLISSMLVIDESKRISWDDLYKHPLFNNLNFSLLIRNNEAEQKFNIILDDIKKRNCNLQNLFNILWEVEKSVNKKGQKQLTIQCIEKLILEIDPKTSRDQVEYLFNKMDVDMNNGIDLNEFLSAFESQGMTSSQNSISRNSIEESSQNFPQLSQTQSTQSTQSIQSINQGSNECKSTSPEKNFLNENNNQYKYIQSNQKLYQPFVNQLGQDESQKTQNQQLNEGIKHVENLSTENQSRCPNCQTILVFKIGIHLLTQEQQGIIPQCNMCKITLDNRHQNGFYNCFVCKSYNICNSCFKVKDLIKQGQHNQTNLHSNESFLNNKDIGLNPIHDNKLTTEFSNLHLNSQDFSKLKEMNKYEVKKIEINLNEDIGTVNQRANLNNTVVLSDLIKRFKNQMDRYVQIIEIDLLSIFKNYGVMGKIDFDGFQKFIDQLNTYNQGKDQIMDYEKKPLFDFIDFQKNSYFIIEELKLVLQK